MEPKYLVDFSDVPNYGETSNVTPHELAYHLLSKIDTKFGDALELMEFDVFDTISQTEDGKFCPRVKLNMLLLVDELGDENIQTASQLFRKTRFHLFGGGYEFFGDCFDFIDKNPVEEIRRICEFLVERGYIPEFMPVSEFGEYSQIRQDELKLCAEAEMVLNISSVGDNGEISESSRYHLFGRGIDVRGTDMAQLVHVGSVRAREILNVHESIVPNV